MPKYEPTEAKLISTETGEEIAPGSKVTNFRGEETEFLYVSRLPEPGKTGKIVVRERFLNLHNVTKELEREVYPTVVEARIEIVEKEI